ncbi:MAG TPA: carboxylate--amine ligase [Acidimicrobiia bacterium]|nr:carboxylate--amine ligase [Acidimicrobiia bacterium]
MTQVSSGRAPAIVVGLDCITGLQTARILAGQGVPVIGVARNPHHYCCRTRACTRVVASDTSGAELTATLERLAVDLGERGVLFPCTDGSVLRISRDRDRLEKTYEIALPSAETVELLIDKVRFYTFAAERDLPIPRTVFLERRADLEKVAGGLTYPCILKPPMKTATWERMTNLKVFKVDSVDDLLATYDRCADWADLLMVQEWIPGPDENLYSCNCYFDASGQPLVTFIARKLRQWPPEVGTSCLGEEVRNDDVLDASVRLFRAVGYHGLGYVEMKRDQRNGKHYIIEPNIGRPTGRSAIAEAGGVALLYTKYCDKAGLPLPSNREQRYGEAKWIYLRRDIQSALFYWKRGDISLADWWRTWRGRKFYAVLDFRDPMPFLLDNWRVVRERLMPRRAQD